jgi:hypothetical protein
MIEHRVNSLLSPYVEKAINFASAKNVSRKHCAFAAIALAILTFLLVAIEAYGLGLITLLANRFANLMVARYPERGHSEEAAILDGFLSRFSNHLFFAGFIFFFAVSDSDFAIPGLFLFFAFYLNDAAYFAYNTSARKELNGKSVLSHLYGLVDDMLVTVFFAVMCLISAAFPFLAVILGFLCLGSAIGRFMEIKLNAKIGEQFYMDENAAHNPEDDFMGGADDDVSDILDKPLVIEDIEEDDPKKED